MSQNEQTSITLDPRIDLTPNKDDSKPTAKAKGIVRQALDLQRLGENFDVDRAGNVILEQEGDPRGGETIVARPIRKRRALFTIYGETPLICNQFSGPKAVAMLAEQLKTEEEKKRKKVFQPREPAADFFLSLYPIRGVQPQLHTDDEIDMDYWLLGDDTNTGIYATGEFGFPATGLKNAIVDVAMDQGLKKTEIRRALFVVGHNNTQLIKIVSKAPPKMRIDLTRIGSGLTKTANIAFRGEFTEWKAEVLIEYNEALISPSTIGELMNVAGFSVGIGEWRTQRSGPYGKFVVSPEVLSMPAPERNYNHW